MVGLETTRTLLETARRKLEARLAEVEAKLSTDVSTVQEPVW
jgi:hypothetical protein